MSAQQRQQLGLQHDSNLHAESNAAAATDDSGGTPLQTTAEDGTASAAAGSSSEDDDVAAYEQEDRCAALTQHIQSHPKTAMLSCVRCSR
jgi:hypothetical protein